MNEETEFRRVILSCVSRLSGEIREITMSFTTYKDLMKYCENLEKNYKNWFIIEIKLEWI